MGKDKGLIDNKYFKQVTELTKLYDTIYKMYQELSKLEKQGKKDSEEYIMIVEIIKDYLEKEKKLFSKFDNLCSNEIENIIYDITLLNDQCEEDMVDKTRLYTTNKIKRLLTRLRDYAYLRNDTFEIEKNEEDNDETFTFPTTMGLAVQVKLSDMKKLGFTYNEPKEKIEKEKEKIENELENSRIVNNALYYKEKLINANFYKLLEEEITKTTTKKYKNELIDYKYNLIYNCVSLENDFVEGKDIANKVQLYKYIVDEYEDKYPDHYENVYSQTIEEEIKNRIQELTSKVYEGEKPNKEEIFEDTIDMLYIKALLNSIITTNTKNHIIEYTNVATNQVQTENDKLYLNTINETVKELKLKQ